MKQMSAGRVAGRIHRLDDPGGTPRAPPVDGGRRPPAGAPGRGPARASGRRIARRDRMGLTTETAGARRRVCPTGGRPFAEAACPGPPPAGKPGIPIGVGADGDATSAGQCRYMVFENRRDAGRWLSDLLRPIAAERPIVIALPRGGVPVAVEVARALDAPLDLLMVRKLGAPQNPELGIGAVAEDGTAVVNTALARRVGADPGGLRPDPRRGAPRAAPPDGAVPRRAAAARRAGPHRHPRRRRARHRPERPRGGSRAPGAGGGADRRGGPGRLARRGRHAAQSRRRGRLPHDPGRSDRRRPVVPGLRTGHGRRGARVARPGGGPDAATGRRPTGGARGAGRDRPGRCTPVRRPRAPPRRPRPRDLRPRQRQQPPQPAQSHGGAPAQGRGSGDAARSTSSPGRRRAAATWSSTSRCSRAGWRP